MANVKISQLPVGTVSDDVVFAGVDSSGTPVTEQYSAISTSDYVTSKIAPKIQNWAFSSAIGAGSLDAYSATYTPTPVLENGTTLQFTAGFSNTTTTPTFDSGDGSGPLPIILGNGDNLNIGDIASGMVTLLAYDADTNSYQLMNPATSGTSPSGVGALLSSAYLSSATALISSNSVPFDQTVTNDLLAYDTNTYQYTVKVSGDYDISVNVNIDWAASSISASTFLSLRVDGTSVADIYVISDGSKINVPLTINKSIRLTADQVVDAYFDVNPGDGIDILGDAAGVLTYMTIELNAASSTSSVTQAALLDSFISSANTSVSSSQTLVFDGVTTSSGISYNSTTGEATIVSTNNYTITAYVLIDCNLSSLASSSLKIRVDGTEVATMPLAWYTSSTIQVIPITKSLRINAGNVVDVYIDIGVGNNAEILGGPGGDVSYFTIISSGNSVAAAVGSTQFSDVNINFTGLASGGQIPIITADSPTAQYRILNAWTDASTATAFDNGDYDLVFTDGTNTYGTINSNDIKTVIDNNSIEFVIATSLGIRTSTTGLFKPTQPGANLYAEYTNGTTDYDVGQFDITFSYVKVAD